MWRVRTSSPFAVDFAPAEPMLLHRAPLRRTDSNSPLRRHAGRTLTFVSHYLPRGHTLRCETAGDWPNGQYEDVRLLDDPTPDVGKWIQSVWQDPDGRLFGWYHGEVFFEDSRLFVPHIGALVSADQGRSWMLLGELMRASPAGVDMTYQNGFLAGGYGDFCVVPDGAGEWFYLHYSCYGPDEARQGVSVARYPIAARDRPPELELWCDGAWRRVADATPIFPAKRGWRHRDPDAFWGPAIHYNHALGCFVMLLNWTMGGKADMVQRGVFISFNKDLADPTGWSEPLQIVKHGSWYPQAIGLGPEEGDTLAGAEARFFMSGFSAWTMRFRKGPPAAALEVSREKFAEIFGVGPW
jgi:hypothetical protein